MCRLLEQRGPNFRIADVDMPGRFDAQGKAALDRGTLTHGREPSLEMRELFDVLPLQLPPAHPADARHVGDRISAGQEFMLAQAPVHDAVKAVAFLGIALDGVSNRLERVEAEVVRLPAIGPSPAICQNSHSSTLTRARSLAG